MARANFKQDYLNYFSNPKTYEELNLVDSGALKLHWSNWNKLLGSIQLKIEQGQISESTNEINQLLEQYKAVEIWIINKQGNIKSNLYELYSYYLDPRLRELWFELNEDTLLSFKAATGPYIRLQSMRWFNFDIYKLFVYQKLLSKSGIIPRQFRMSVHMPIRAEFSESVLNPIEATIVQVSKNGMLIKVDSRSDLQSLKLCDNARFFANLNPFLLSQGKRIEESNEIFDEDSFKGHNKLNQSFKLKDNILNLGNNFQNIFYSNGSEFYLFVSLQDLCDDDKRLFQSPIEDAINRYEEFALSHLKKIA